MRLGSGVAMAVAQAGGYGSDSTPSLGTSICCRMGPRKGREKKKKSTWRGLFWEGPLGSCVVTRPPLPSSCVLLTSWFQQRRGHWGCAWPPHCSGPLGHRSPAPGVSSLWRPSTALASLSSTPQVTPGTAIHPLGQAAGDAVAVGRVECPSANFSGDLRKSDDLCSLRPGAQCLLICSQSPSPQNSTGFRAGARGPR